MIVSLVAILAILAVKPSGLFGSQKELEERIEPDCGKCAKERIDRGIKASDRQDIFALFSGGNCSTCWPPALLPVLLLSVSCLSSWRLLAEGPPLRRRFCPAGHQLGFPGSGGMVSLGQACFFGLGAYWPAS